MQALAEFWKRGMDEALHRSTASSQAFRGHMQQLEVDCQTRVQQLEDDCEARLQQREAEFKGLEKDCFANVEATAKLHEAASQKRGNLQKMLDVSKRKTADLVEHVDCLKDRKRQLKRLVTGLDERMAVLQSSLDACKRNMRELEDENASLLQRSAELEDEQKALKQQVQHLQRDLDQAHQAVQSKGDQGQPTDPQAAAAEGSVSRQLLQKTKREAVLKKIVLLMGEQQTVLTDEKLNLETELAAALQANWAHAASAAAAETVIQHQGASLAAAKQASEQHAISLAAAQEAADKAARQASEQHAISLAGAQEAAEKAAMQAAKHEAEIQATSKAVQEKARLETAQLHAADREVWAAEKAELLSQLQCARTGQPPLAVQPSGPDAHST